MVKRILFKKKRKNKYLIFSLIIFILIFLFYFFIISTNNNYFEVNSFNQPFYIIPSDKGGFKVKNLDKKSLHLLDNKNIKTFINDELIYKYSIQIFSADNYDIINEKYNNLLKYNNKLNSEDLFIVTFDNTLNIEYFLLYKNFETREIALDYCKNYYNISPKCLIINVKNLD